MMMRRTMTDLADDLTMLATQLREHLRGGGDPPHPHTIDDWMTEYRDAYRLHRQYPTRAALAARLRQIEFGPDRGR